jgi:hypothetical protein
MAGYYERRTAPPRGGSAPMVHDVTGFAIRSLVPGAAASAMRPAAGNRYDVR